MSIADLDLTTRTEAGAALTATQHDNNLTAIQDKINAILAVLNPLAAVAEYGECYIATNQTVNVAVGGTWYKIADFTSGHADVVTFSAADDALVATNAGDYAAHATIAMAGQVNCTYKYRFAVDGTTVDQHEINRKVSSADVGAAALHGILTLTAGQKVSLYVTGDVTGNTTIYAGTTFSLSRKH